MLDMKLTKQSVKSSILMPAPFFGNSIQIDIPRNSMLVLEPLSADKDATMRKTYIERRIIFRLGTLLPRGP